VRSHARRPEPNYTIAQAIGDARWVQNTPDAVIAPDRSKQIILTLLAAIEASPCYLKASMLGMRPFVILPYDRAGDAAMLEWIRQADAHGCRADKVDDARAMLMQWRQRPDRVWPA
jgi:hypothetical protein